MNQFVVNADGRAPFVYSPLDPSKDCIRLLSVEASRNVTALQCRLTHVNFSDRPRYQALSYMWGDESEKKLILVDGKKFYVTRNLYDAIHFLRRCKPHCLFWIDAICINQDDVHEKNRQIRIMPHIYFRATTVIAWLGTKRITPALVRGNALACAACYPLMRAGLAVRKYNGVLKPLQEQQGLTVPFPDTRTYC